MKTPAPGVLLLVAASFTAAPQGGDKEENISASFKFEMKYLEKTWGIKLKTVHKSTVTVPVGKSQTAQSPALKFTLEFTKDVEDVKAMQVAFKPWFPPYDPKNPPGMYFY